jgi:hypothetical protein
MNDCKPRGFQLTRYLISSRIHLPTRSLFPYRKAVGSLLFASICKRPDISFAINQRRLFESFESTIEITFHQSVGFFHLTQGAAFLPRASPALYRRIHFSEEEFANADYLYDSGIGNQDQSLDVSLMLVSPATLPSIAVDATTIPAIAADAPTIPAIAADAPTLPTIEGKAPIIPIIEVDALTIPAFAENGTTIQ